MAVVAQWKNDTFATPLCDPISFHPTLHSALNDVPFDCLCLTKNDKQCNGCANYTSTPITSVCQSCSDSEAAYSWRIDGTTVAVAFNCTADSCVFVSSDGLWVLDISAGTLTYDETNVWSASSAWNCTGDNFVTSSDPADGYSGFLCICPINHIPECGSCVGCDSFVLPECWELTIPAEWYQASCNSATGPYTLTYSGSIGGTSVTCGYKTDTISTGPSTTCNCTETGFWYLGYSASSNRWIVAWRTTTPFPGAGPIVWALDDDQFQCNGTNILTLASANVLCTNAPGFVPNSVTVAPANCS